MVKKEIYDMYQKGDPKMIDLFHGYTYSAHPLASAALIATLEVYLEEGLFERVAQLESYLEESLHSLKGLKNDGKIKILTKKPILPQRKEIIINPKSRSAKLRAIEVL